MGAFTLPTPSFETTLENLQPMEPDYSDPETGYAAMNPNPLNLLPEPALPNVTVEPSTSLYSDSSTLGPIAGLAGYLTQHFGGQAIAGGMDANSFAGKTLKQIWTALDLEDAVFLVLGLLLIAAGIFSFKQTQTIVREGGRAAATIAAA